MDGKWQPYNRYKNRPVADVSCHDPMAYFEWFRGKLIAEETEGFITIPTQALLGKSIRRDDDGIG